MAGMAPYTAVFHVINRVFAESAAVLQPGPVNPDARTWGPARQHAGPFGRSERADMPPVAFSSGTGSAMRQPMAVVIIGGQLLCLAVTLLLTPVFYSVFDDMQSVWIPRRIAAMKARLSFVGDAFESARESLKAAWGRHGR